MLIDALLNAMVEKNASDIFLSSGSAPRIRINGRTFPISKTELTPEFVETACRELAGEKRWEKFQNKSAIDFSHVVPGTGSFRANVFRQKNTVACVIRYVRWNIPQIEELGVSQITKILAMEKRGLILVCGATGSGKSTTLAAMLEHRNENDDGHILTIEDPIEFIFHHKRCVVNQREIGVDTVDLMDALVSAVREAPDVMMVGEVRDPETLSKLMMFAQTGHLVMTTLHANNATHAISRMARFFPEEARESLMTDLSMSLKAVLCQRLVVGNSGKRVMVQEVLVNSGPFPDLIAKGDTSKIRELMAQATSLGTVTFDRNLISLVRNGVITREEALANADSKTDLSWALDNT